MNRFLEVDLVGIRAQTHASLTACRGLIRYAEITGGAPATPVYHLLDPKVSKASGYSKVIIR